MNRLNSLIFLVATLTAPASLGAAAPDREYDSRQCEVFVNSLELEQFHYGGGGYDELFFKLWISVDKAGIAARGGKVLAVGMRLNGQDDVVATSEIEPSYYMLRQSLWERGRETHDYPLTRFAVFLDIAQADGQTDRVWLKDGWHDFDWPAVFDGYPVHVESRGPNYSSFVQDPSPVYVVRNACRR